MRFLAFFLSLTCFGLKATTITSVGCGNWSNTATWDLNRLPEETDTVKIVSYVLFDQDFTNISPGLLYVDECGVLCGDYQYTGCFLVYGIVNIKKMVINYGHSDSYNNFASTTEINVRSSILLTQPAIGMSNHGVPWCVGPSCMFECRICEFYRGPEECYASVDELAANVYIYPNPASDFIVVEGFQKYALQLTDVSGKVLYMEQFDTETQLNLSGFPNGLYYLQLEKDGKKYTSKIVVE